MQLRDWRLTTPCRANKEAFRPPSSKHSCTADGSASSVRKRGRLTGFPPRRAPNPSLPLFLVPSVSLCFFWHPKGDPAKNMGPLNGGKPQHVPSVTVSCLLASYVPPPPLLCRVARGLGCRPSAALIGAPPCSVPQRASAAPLGLAGSWSRVPPVAGAASL